MPFYEYECKSCGHALEAMQKISDSPLKKCPECGKSSLQRLMSAPVFRLKGSGWYETDFKSDQDGKRNLADRPEPDSPKDDKADAKNDAKDSDVKAPDAKADSPADKGTGKTPPVSVPTKAASSTLAATKTPAKKPAAKPKRPAAAARKKPAKASAARAKRRR
jgi:putative FmdB family regulatory protein